ncbi:uncharacterized protein LOC122063290 [Macadamia integrifolia]|uniref:uncharacterized protein LOC122063290 n=1 Tax=Macadamia integrifolia TaxID=60698 RepID=UPI001C500BB5|nr:uncharacterized protein LOC122063290 [Macadamia integrifolia]XP_042482933.1 uncharacterized protein LOC122063290 [Macadamia integrifolia]XP_042482934.1 uncharacterized protein LOC122063290 [Macadamia integrifolia]XP_042482935.1 uncharacterized protein LOC122063290 [Macadamia integrifolia]XP_042482936.1 uncharacterized protein LOC122063290 [Macadamia integrifolia]XP_042482937.1 uncharacterized protein LOC122063290 [Macadamia integrifolia]XP_042482938.1 uncharacterized protein LOC122063290 [
MAIVKNNFGVSKLDGEFSPGSRDSMSTDEDELHKRSSTSESDIDDDEDEDGVDSGAGSDDFDMSELGEIGAEYCQLGSGNCSIPYELYDLPDLGEVLTLDVWNNCLTEEERFSLAEFLPDMDQETFMRTLKELFSGSNFHFGSPVAMLFDMLKEGLCEPRVTLYRRGLNFFQKREHYHLLRKYQNLMVSNLIQIRDAWENCAGYSIEERLRVLNIMRSQRSLMYEKMEARGLETDTSDRDESGEGFWSKRLKDIKLKPKIGRRDIYPSSPTLNNSSRGRPVPLEPAKHRKSNPKGILKFAGSKALSVKGFVGRFPSSIQPGLESKSRSYLPTLALSRKDQVSEYDSESAPRSRGQIRGEEDAEGPPYVMDHLRDRTHGSAMSKAGLFKSGKKNKFFKSEDEYAAESLMGLPLAIQNDLHSHGRSRGVNQMAEREPLKAKPSGEKSSYNCYSRVAGAKAKHTQKVQNTKDQIKATKDQAQNLLLRGNQADWSVGREPIQHNKVKEEAFNVDHPVKHDEWSVKGKRWKMGKDFQTGKNSVDLDFKGKSHRTFPTQMNDMLFHSDYRTKASLDKVKKKSSRNGGHNMEELRVANMFARNEETESDSSEQVSEEEFSPLRNKLGHPRGVEGHRSTSTKAIADPKKGIKLGRKDREYAEALEQLRMADVDVYSSKGKQKGKVRDPSYMHTDATGISEENGYGGFAKTNDDGKKTYKVGKNGHVLGEPGERLCLPSLKAYPPERKHKGKVDHDYSVPQSNYMHDYIDEEENNLHLKQRLVHDHGLTNKLGKKGQNSKAHLSDRHERSKFSLSGCNSKKRKGKADVKYMDGTNESDQMPSSPQQLVDDSTSLKKRGKRKVEAETDSLAIENSEPLVSERVAIDVEAEAKPPKKPFTLITPTVHTGFSFSIIHLLSAVRMAMITPNAEDSSELDNHLSRSDGRHKTNNEEQSRRHETNVDTNNSEHVGQKALPSLTVQDIVNRVRSNPGDPCILETQEPLQDLVRGVLKIFSSKTAPLGAKGWKTLVCYEKSTKSWSWIGPLIDSSSDLEAAEEETSSEAWGLPHKMLVKLVDSFANWLKSGQETLQQIGSLPAPPLTLMQPNLDEKERFRDLRAQKSLTTISPSSEEVRAYFRKEELLRYSVPDRAFSYTAADGRKSIVAPLRRCGGKPTSKARDHFMLKPDRPPHVTILCLVRDAAARLPGSIGTRADVCTLIRDSQYIVENVSDAQINQVVSGALDRLHYERDPCVQFDGDRKLWVYLHREREEEDFEDDGTSSTKKWKRQRKDGTEQSDPGTLNMSYHGSGEPIASGLGYDLGSDLNVEPSPIHEGRRTELGYNDSKQKIEDNVEPYVGQGGMHLGCPPGWEARESKMLCQENSTNEDFDDETFSRERPVGLLSAGL